MKHRNVLRVGEILRDAGVTHATALQIAHIIEEEGIEDWPIRLKFKPEEFAALYTPLISIDAKRELLLIRRRRELRDMLERTPGVYFLTGISPVDSNYLRKTLSGWAPHNKFAIRTHTEGGVFIYGIFPEDEAPPAAPPGRQQKDRPAWCNSIDTIET